MRILFDIDKILIFFNYENCAFFRLSHSKECSCEIIYLRYGKMLPEQVGFVRCKILKRLYKILKHYCFMVQHTSDFL